MDRMPFVLFSLALAALASLTSACGDGAVECGHLEDAIASHLEHSAVCVEGEACEVYLPDGAERSIPADDVELAFLLERGKAACEGPLTARGICAAKVCVRNDAGESQ